MNAPQMFRSQLSMSDPSRLTNSAAVRQAMRDVLDLLDF